MNRQNLNKWIQDNQATDGSIRKKEANEILETLLLDKTGGVETLEDIMFFIKKIDKNFVNIQKTLYSKESKEFFENIVINNWTTQEYIELFEQNGISLTEFPIRYKDFINNNYSFEDIQKLHQSTNLEITMGDVLAAGKRDWSNEQFQWFLDNMNQSPYHSEIISFNTFNFRDKKEITTNKLLIDAFENQLAFSRLKAIKDTYSDYDWSFLTIASLVKNEYPGEEIKQALALGDVPLNIPLNIKQPELSLSIRQQTLLANYMQNKENSNLTFGSLTLEDFFNLSFSVQDIINIKQQYNTQLKTSYFKRINPQASISFEDMQVLNNNELFYENWVQIAAANQWTIEDIQKTKTYYETIQAFENQVFNPSALLSNNYAIDDIISLVTNEEEAYQKVLSHAIENNWDIDDIIKIKEKTNFETHKIQTPALLENYSFEDIQKLHSNNFSIQTNFKDLIDSKINEEQINWFLDNTNVNIRFLDTLNFADLIEGGFKPNTIKNLYNSGFTTSLKNSIDHLLERRRSAADQLSQPLNDKDRKKYQDTFIEAEQELDRLKLRQNENNQKILNASIRQHFSVQDLIELKETMQIQIEKNINLNHVFLLQNNYSIEDIQDLRKEFVVSNVGLENYLIEQKWNINDVIDKLEEENRCRYLNTFDLANNGYTKEDIEKAINNGASNQRLETLSIKEILSMDTTQDIFETLIHCSELNKNPEEVLEQIKSAHTTQEQKLFSGTIQPTLNKKEYEKDKAKYIQTLSPEQRENFEDKTSKKSGLISRLKRKIYNTEDKKENLNI